MLIALPTAASAQENLLGRFDLIKSITGLTNTQVNNLLAGKEVTILKNKEIVIEFDDLQDVAYVKFLGRQYVSGMVGVVTDFKIEPVIWGGGGTSHTNYSSMSNKNISVNSKVSFIKFKFGGEYTYLSGVEIMGTTTGSGAELASISNIKMDVWDKATTITYTRPNKFQKVDAYDADTNTLLYSGNGEIAIKNLTPETTYNIKLKVHYTNTLVRDHPDVITFTTRGAIPAQNVDNLTAAISNKKDVKLAYALKDETDYVQIYRDNKLLIDNYKDTSYTDTTTAYNTSYTYKVVAINKAGTLSSGVTKTIKIPTDAVPDVSNVYLSIVSKKDVKLTYTVPSNSSHLRIYRDGELLVDNYKDATYTDTTTKYDASYTYKIVNVNADGKESNGVTKQIKTPQSPPKDASSLSYTATSNSVSLKWRNTTHDEFTAVTIYRKNNTVAANVRALFSAGDGYTKLHSGKVETYTDNSVEPDTSYKYKITTTIAGVESDGVTVDVKTKPVTLDDTTLEQQTNGDYVVTWGAPTTGKMQINVGGTKYAVVPAANKTFTIPAADVKFNALGSPDVQLVPLNDAEQPVGPGTKPGGGGLGSIIGGGGGEGIFDAPDLVKAAASLLALVGGFILLGLAFRVVPMLVKTIRNALISGGAKR